MLRLGSDGAKDAQHAKREIVLRDDGRKRGGWATRKDEGEEKVVYGKVLELGEARRGGHELGSDDGRDECLEAVAAARESDWTTGPERKRRQSSRDGVELVRDEWVWWTLQDKRSRRHRRRLLGAVLARLP